MKIIEIKMSTHSLYPDFCNMWENYVDELMLMQPELGVPNYDATGSMLKNENLSVYVCLGSETGYSTPEPVGFFVIGNEKIQPYADCYIAEFYVVPYMRRRGIGDAMVDFIVNYYGDDFFYEVLENNDNARDFWEYEFDKRDFNVKRIIKDVYIELYYASPSFF